MNWKVVVDLVLITGLTVFIRSQYEQIKEQNRCKRSE